MSLSNKASAQLEIHIAGIEPRPDGKPHIKLLSHTVGNAHLSQPEETSVLWRYLSFGKLASLLAMRALWFSRLDLLDDPFEGATPLPDIQRRMDLSRKQGTSAEDESAIWAATRRWLLVSCWYLGEDESDAMWRLYAANGEGVAVRTTLDRLRYSLEESPGQYTDPTCSTSKSLPLIVLGQIHYIDLDILDLEGDSLFARYFVKKPAFRHESEFRALAPLPEITREGVLAAMEPECPGVYVKVDLAALVTEIVVAPRAPTWFRHAVGTVVRRFCLEAPIRVSVLDEKPKF